MPERPDGDNLDKFLNDCFKGVVWEDDAQITWLLRSKSRTKSSEGCTFFFIKEIPKCCPDFDELLKDIQEYIRIKEEDLHYGT